MTTSYQRRKKDISYYEQCIMELEAHCETLVDILVKNGIYRMPLSGKGLNGDSLLTPYNDDNFLSDLMTKSRLK